MDTSRQVYTENNGLYWNQNHQNKERFVGADNFHTETETEVLGTVNRSRELESSAVHASE